MFLLQQLFLLLPDLFQKISPDQANAKKENIDFHILGQEEGFMDNIERFP